MNDLTHISVVKDIMKRHGFDFSKRLGQNFLINPSVSPKIAQMGISGDDERIDEGKKCTGVLEIGPGIGVLTRELALRAEKVVAVEIDRRLIPVLNETLSEFDNVTVINGDIMKLDIAKLLDEHFQELDVSVCANLPYYITTPIIMLLLESRLPFKSVTAMVQKEAGVRLCAKTGTRECGAVTYAVRYYSEPQILFNVSSGSFMPSPNVDSCVIKLVLNAETPFLPNSPHEKMFFAIIKGAFSQRRKTLLNSLSANLNTDKNTIKAVLNNLEISENVRPEQLKIDDFITMTNIFLEVKNDN